MKHLFRKLLFAIFCRRQGLKRILQIIQANDFSVQPRKMRPQITAFFSYQSNRALRTSCSSLYYLGEVTWGWHSAKRVSKGLAIAVCLGRDEEVKLRVLLPWTGNAFCPIWPEHRIFLFFNVKNVVYQSSLSLRRGCATDFGIFCSNAATCLL